jgi:aquaporin Z
MVRKLAVEAIGTFFLVLTIGMVVLDPGATPFAPIAIGAVLMVMVYAGGHVSGAHYNPAVTLAVWMRGACTVHEAIGYWVFQLVSAAVAATVVLWAKGGGPLTQQTLNIPHVLFAEFIFTFALCWVVLNVATARGVAGNSYYGLAIASTVTGGAFAMGPMSGAAFNPAVSTGVLVFGVISFRDLWAFLVPQMLAGAAAAAVFNGLDLGDDKPTTATLEDQAGLSPQAMPDVDL